MICTADITPAELYLENFFSFSFYRPSVQQLSIFSLSRDFIIISGPALSGTLVNTIGFEWMLFGIAILCFIYAPLMYFLRAPPTKEEKKVSY